MYHDKLLVMSWQAIHLMFIVHNFTCSCSCGIFTIKKTKHWNGMNLTENFSQKDMEMFRKKIPAELFFSPLNNLESIKDDVLAMVNS